MTLFDDLTEDLSTLSRAFVRVTLADALPLLIGLLAYVVVAQYVRRRNMPPGPRGIPFIGNKHQVPSIKPWRKFAEWSKQYGKCALPLRTPLSHITCIECRAYLLVASRKHTGHRSEVPTQLYLKPDQSSTTSTVLGTAQVAWDLLEKRSEIYSSRPRFVVA